LFAFKFIPWVLLLFENTFFFTGTNYQTWNIQTWNLKMLKYLRK
jgi:uncharacterized RDD family membrane protein YckC